MAVGIADEVGRELLQLGEILGGVADPHLAEVALIGGAERHAFVGAGGDGERPAVGPGDGQRLGRETEFGILNARAKGGGVAVDCDGGMWEREGRHGLDHAGIDDAVRVSSHFTSFV